MLDDVARLVEQVAGGTVIVAPAHMELAEPTVAQGFAACVARGATEVVVVPYMLAPGRHVTFDIPELVAQAGLAHPDIGYRMAPPLGIHSHIAHVVLERAEL